MAAIGGIVEFVTTGSFVQGSIVGEYAFSSAIGRLESGVTNTFNSITSSVSGLVSKGVTAARNWGGGKTNNSPVTQTTRVGRWMSKNEHDKMVETGYVQKPYGVI